ncbi:MAG: response regulator [Lachnospiraceae bacterium]|nr:response regulator [Lachnospiraceae bacterium]
MDIMVVDDERIAREGISKLLKEFYPDAKIHVFARSDEAVEAAKTRKFFIACLDIKMEPYDGIETANMLAKTQNKLNIIFTTGFDSFTKEAMDLHASGYIVKPVTKKKLENELSFLRYEEEKKTPPLVAHCFGNFDFFIDGKSAEFSYNKSRELLAYLIDRQGAICTNNEISAILGEDSDGGELGYSYLNGIRRELIRVFEEAGYPDLIVHTRGGMRINTDMISCDYFDMLKGKQSAIDAYNGEYMSQYSWAEFTNGEFWNKYRNNTSS